MTISEAHKVLKLADTAVGEVAVSIPNDSAHEIGRGRSGVVFRRKGAKGHDLACKVFDSRGLTKVVQWLTLGAPNPYMWNANAVQCAKIRRDILNLLVPVWTKGQVAVAGAETAIWNDKLTTFELQTRFVRGRTAALHHPLRDATEDEAGRLWRQTLPNLRSFLEHAGFDGLLWQAGIGNPVALNWCHQLILRLSAVTSASSSAKRLSRTTSWMSAAMFNPLRQAASDSAFFCAFSMVPTM